MKNHLARNTFVDFKTNSQNLKSNVRSICLKIFYEKAVLKFSFQVHIALEPCFLFFVKLQASHCSDTKNKVPLQVLSCKFNKIQDNCSYIELVGCLLLRCVSLLSKRILLEQYKLRKF